MVRWNVPFLVLAGAGLLASATVHTSAILGSVHPFGDSVWLLHVGLFVVWLPAVLVARHRIIESQNRSIRTVLSGCPDWLSGVLALVFAYACVNFLIFMAQTQGQRHPPDNVVLRGFSGHWVFFYLAAIAVLLETRTDLRAPCTRGHTIMADGRCPICGWPDSPRTP